MPPHSLGTSIAVRHSQTSARVARIDLAESLAAKADALNSTEALTGHLVPAAFLQNASSASSGGNFPHWRAKQIASAPVYAEGVFQSAASATPVWFDPFCHSHIPATMKHPDGMPSLHSYTTPFPTEVGCFGWCLVALPPPPIAVLPNSQPPAQPCFLSHATPMHSHSVGHPYYSRQLYGPVVMPKSADDLEWLQDPSDSAADLSSPPALIGFAPTYAAPAHPDGACEAGSNSYNHLVLGTGFPNQHSCPNFVVHPQQPKEWLFGQGLLASQDLWGGGVYHPAAAGYHSNYFMGNPAIYCDPYCTPYRFSGQIDGVHPVAVTQPAMMASRDSAFSFEGPWNWARSGSATACRSLGSSDSSRSVDASTSALQDLWWTTNTSDNNGLRQPTRVAGQAEVPTGRPPTGAAAFAHFPPPHALFEHCEPAAFPPVNSLVFVRHPVPLLSTAPPASFERLDHNDPSTAPACTRKFCSQIASTTPAEEFRYADAPPASRSTNSVVACEPDIAIEERGRGAGSNPTGSHFDDLPTLRCPLPDEPRLDLSPFPFTEAAAARRTDEGDSEQRGQNLDANLRTTTSFGAGSSVRHGLCGQVIPARSASAPAEAGLFAKYIQSCATASPFPQEANAESAVLG